MADHHGRGPGRRLSPRGGDEPARKPGPGGVGDGLPSLPSGEPVLARWFVIAMLVLVPIGVGVAIWAFLSIRDTTIPVAERRPAGTAEVTHDRGQGALGESTDRAPGPACAEDIDVVGDANARATATRTLSALCQILQRGSFPEAEEGLRRWAEQDGALRFAVFERTGLDSSARVEDGEVIIELNAKFQFDDATLAAPMVLHELVHLAGGWPGSPVGADGELAAMAAQDAACERLVARGSLPRGCGDAAELLELQDPRSALVEAGYRDAQ